MPVVILPETPGDKSEDLESVFNRLEILVTNDFEGLPPILNVFMMFPVGQPAIIRIWVNLTPLTVKLMK